MNRSERMLSEVIAQKVNRVRKREGKTAFTILPPKSFLRTLSEAFYCVTKGPAFQSTSSHILNERPLYDIRDKVIADLIDYGIVSYFATQDNYSHIRCGVRMKKIRKKKERKILAIVTFTLATRA